MKGTGLYNRRLLLNELSFVLSGITKGSYIGDSATDKLKNKLRLKAVETISQRHPQVRDFLLAIEKTDLSIRDMVDVFTVSDDGIRVLLRNKATFDIIRKSNTPLIWVQALAQRLSFIIENGVNMLDDKMSIEDVKVMYRHLVEGMDVGHINVTWYIG